MIDYTMSSMEKQFKVNRYGDIITIDVERKHATQLADYIVSLSCEVTEVRLQYATNTGKIIIKLNELIDEELIDCFCNLYFRENGKTDRR